jgi:hypothetical protein
MHYHLTKHKYLLLAICFSNSFDNSALFQWKDLLNEMIYQIDSLLFDISPPLCYSCKLCFAEHSGRDIFMPKCGGIYINNIYGVLSIDWQIAFPTEVYKSIHFYNTCQYCLFYYKTLCLFHRCKNLSYFNYNNFLKLKTCFPVRKYYKSSLYIAISNA